MKIELHFLYFSGGIDSISSFERAFEGSNLRKTCGLVVRRVAVVLGRKKYTNYVKKFARYLNNRAPSVATEHF